MPLQQAMTPITPLEPGMEMFERAKAQHFFSAAVTARSSLERPLSHISVAYTDIEDDSSEFEEFSGSSVSSHVLRLHSFALTTCRATTGEAKQQYQHLRKSLPPVKTSGHSLLSGQSPSQ
jgi:hypothetical protein